MTSGFLSRRSFLLAAGAATASTAAIMVNQDLQLFIRRSLRNSPPPHPISHLRGGFFQTPRGVREFGPAAAVENRNVFDWHLASGATRIVPVSAAPHVVETDPEDSTLSIVGTKFKDTISVVDWKLEKEVAFHCLPPGSYFYGHAAFVRGQKQILAPLLFKSNFAIGVFEFPSLKLLDTISTNHRWAHEITSIGGSEFVMGLSSNSDHLPAFAIYDHGTRQLTEYPIPSRKSAIETSVPHIQICDDSKVIANLQLNNRAFQSGLASFDLSTRETAVLIEPSQQNIGELLSFTYDHQYENAWVTGPRDSIMYVWNVPRGELVHKIEFGRGALPMNVALIHEQNLMIAGTADRFQAYDTKTFQRLSHLEEKWPQEIARRGLCKHTRGV